MIGFDGRTGNGGLVISAFREQGAWVSLPLKLKLTEWKAMS